MRGLIHCTAKTPGAAARRLLPPLASLVAAPPPDASSPRTRLRGRCALCVKETPSHGSLSRQIDTLESLKCTCRSADWRRASCSCF